MAVVLGLAVSFVAAEVVLRALGVSYPVLVEPDPVAGAHLRPFVEGWFTEEGRGYVQANDLGYRDRVHARQKPAGRFRVAAFGDSYTEALQVPIEATWWRLLESRLGECGALGTLEPEVMNFAISGIGTAQQLEIYRQIGAGYDPDLVVLAFVGNDVQNNHRGFGDVDIKPFYDLDDQGRLVLDASFRDNETFQRRTAAPVRFIRSVSDYSRVLQLVLELRRVMARLSVREQQAGSPVGFSSDPTAPELIEAWAVTEALLADFARRVRENGSEFLLVAVSSPHQVHPDLEYRRHRLEEVERGTDLLYLNKRLGRLAGREGIEYLSLSEPFQIRAERTGECLHGFENMLPCGGHWNESGHQLAAEHVLQAVCHQLERSAEASPSG